MALDLQHLQTKVLVWFVYFGYECILGDNTRDICAKSASE